MEKTVYVNVSQTTKTAPTSNKLKDLLDRDPDLLLINSLILMRNDNDKKIILPHASVNQINHNVR